MCRLRMCHNRYIEYTLMYIGYVEYNEYSFMYFITYYIFYRLLISNSLYAFITFQDGQFKYILNFKLKLDLLFKTNWC